MISPKKQKFIDYIKNFTDTKGRAPTFVEIMNGLKPLAGIVIVRVHTLHGKQEMVDIFLVDMLMIMKK